MASDDSALSNPSYWDTHYGRADGPDPAHEWFRTPAALAPFLQRVVFDVPRLQPSSSSSSSSSSVQILHLGSGDSTVPEDFAARGYTRQLCVDFSPVVVARMRARHAGVAGVRWAQADVRDMRAVVELEHGKGDGSVDVAFDKGTLDAMVHGSPWAPPEGVLADTGRYVREVHRVLKRDGVFVWVSFRQPHFAKLLLEPDGLWDVDVHVLDGGDGAFDYYGYVLTKKAD